MFGESSSDMYHRLSKPVAIVYDVLEYNINRCHYDNLYCHGDILIENKDIYNVLDRKTLGRILQNKIKKPETVNDFDKAILKLSNSYLNVHTFIRCKYLKDNMKFSSWMIEDKWFKGATQNFNDQLIDSSQFMHQLIIFFENLFMLNNIHLKKEIDNNEKIQYVVKDFSIFNEHFISECKSFQKDCIEKFRNYLNIALKLEQKINKKDDEVPEYVEAVLKIYIDAINNLSAHVKESYSYVLTNFGPKVKNDIDVLENIFTSNIVDISRNNCMAALCNKEDLSNVIFKNSTKKKDEEGLMLFDDLSAIYTKNGKEIVINGSSSTMRFLEGYVDRAIRATFSTSFFRSIAKCMKVFGDISMREKMIFFLLYAENANILSEDILMKCKNKAMRDKNLSFHMLNSYLVHEIEIHHRAQMEKQFKKEQRQKLKFQKEVGNAI